jgi:hypothetical protein
MVQSDPSKTYMSGSWAFAFPDQSARPDAVIPRQITGKTRRQNGRFSFSVKLFHPPTLCRFIQALSVPETAQV